MMGSGEGNKLYQNYMHSTCLVNVYMHKYYSRYSDQQVHMLHCACLDQV